MNIQQTNKMPEIYCAISISFEKGIDASFISDRLKQLGIVSFEMHKPKFDSIVCVKIAIIKNEPCWYLDEALAKMFLQVDSCLAEIKEIINKYHGETWIDVAFYQHGTPPALTFSGENMKKIRYLEADISIDAY